MDIAIRFEKYNLDDSMCIFKPINTIRGMYDAEEDIFVSESGDVLSQINGSSMYETLFFDFPTNIKNLKKLYGSKVSEEALLTNYFDMVLENCYFGFYNDDEEICLSKIPTCDILYKYVDLASGKSNEKPTITFDLEYLKKLRDSKTIEEVQKKLDTFLNITDGEEKNIDEAFADEKMPAKSEKKNKLKLDKMTSKEFNLAKLRKEVLSKIIAQDEAVNKVTTAIAVNYTSKDPKHKSHLLIIGPSGTGKTEMINIIADYLDVPYFKADATAYTKEGYVGKSVQSILLGLLDAADGDIEKAQNGILIIDEIDKKSGGDRGDVGGESVLHSLLKIMDRDVIEVNTNYYNSIDFDTSNLTIIFMGAFSRIYEKKRKSKKKPIGFSTENKSIDSNNSIQITKQDLIDDGMTAEFMGRIDEVIPTKEFTLEDLVAILYKSKNSPIKREKQYFKDMNIDTTFSKSFYTAVAHSCLNAGTGARDLKREVHESLIDAYDEVLMNKGKIKKLKFTGDTVKDSKKYYVL